jgi:hypothetical protein
VPVLPGEVLFFHLVRLTETGNVHRQGLFLIVISTEEKTGAPGCWYMVSLSMAARNRDWFVSLIPWRAAE